MKITVGILTATLFAGTAVASPLAYFAILNGPNEAPPNASPGTGTADVTIDTVAHLLHVEVTFSGLIAPNTASHIHCCTASPFTGTAGVATTVPTFTGFPTGVTSGTYDHTFDLSLSSSFNPSFVTAHGGTPAGAEAALAAGLSGGNAYLNIHSQEFPGGEIRGFLEPVPEPATWLLAGVSLLGLGVMRRSVFNRRA